MIDRGRERRKALVLSTDRTHLSHMCPALCRALSFQEPDMTEYFTKLSCPLDVGIAPDAAHVLDLGPGETLGSAYPDGRLVLVLDGGNGHA